MKKFTLLLLFMISYSFAETALLLHKGWQLVGSTTKITDMKLFDVAHVEQVWHYDARNQQWKGYSPQPDITKKISEKGYQTISTLESWHGFWVKSKDDWTLVLPTTEHSDENITLEKGWNLISLPVDTVVSAHIFDGTTVWKYTKEREWQLFDNNNTENFPAISHITNSDGIWVKSDKKQVISTVSDAAKLHNFNTIAAMKAYIEDMLLTYKRPYCGYVPIILSSGGVYDKAGEATANETFEAPQASQKAENTSQTNLQESGVDEADILKHNDKYIFYLATDPKNMIQMQLLVNTFERITNNQLNPLRTIPLGNTPVDMYLKENKLIILSKYGLDNYKVLTPTPEEKIAIQNGEYVASMVVDIYDISDIDHITKTTSYKINGQYNSSRMVANKLYLITQFMPSISVDYPHIYIDAPECEAFFKPVYTDVATDESTPNASSVNQSKSDTPTIAQNRAVAIDYAKYARCYDLHADENNRYYRLDYDHPKISHENLVPYYTKDKNEHEMLITPKSFYASDKKDQEPIITTVSQINITNGTLEKTTSVLGSNNTVYASDKALYMVSNQYPIFYTFDRYQPRSMIYKFNLTPAVAYNAAGFVKGTVLNQFSLSEYNDILRIATTSGTSWQNNTTNSLYTLKSIGDRLLIQGVLSGLGKEGETIHSVRFMGDRGYIVTFKRTDPFYTLDLSDPAHPKKAGELQIDGFSSYLHPIGENMILGFGRDATPDGQVAGLKLELFDVTDFTHPISLDSYTLPGNYTNSEIEYNHKALAYRTSDNLFAFPYNTRKGYSSIQDYLGIFQIQNDQINAYKPLEGNNITNFYNIKSLQRGVIFDLNDTSYIAYFSNGKIYYTTLNSLKEE